MGVKDGSPKDGAAALGLSRALLASSRDAGFVIDARARVSMMNGAAEEATGWRSSDAIGRRIEEVCQLTGGAVGSIPAAFSVDVLSGVPGCYVDGAADGHSEGRATLRPRNGHPRRVTHRTTLIRTGDGSIDGALLVLQLEPDADVGVLEGIGQSEYCRRILDAEPACVKVVSQDGRLLEMNAAGLAMLEAGSLEEAQGQPLIEFIAPAYRAAFGALHRKVMQGDSGTLEFEVIGLHGTRRCLETQAVPLRDPEGQIAGLLGVTQDVTERRRANQALRDSERRYHTLSNVAPVGIFQTGLSGSTTYVNPHFSEVTGLAAEGAVEQGWLAAVHPEDVARVRQEWCLASARQQVYAGELRFLRSDRTVRWALAFAAPERDRDGSFNGYIGTITDISGRLQAERVIESQNRVLEMIAKGSPLAETLNTLLRSVEEQVPGMLSSILLLDADGIHVRHGAAPSLPADYVRALDGVPIGERAGSCGTAAYLRRPVIVEDIATDPLWTDYRELGLAFGLRACWSTPIFDMQGSVLGTFAMYFREPRRPEERHQRLIQLSTSLAALAIGRHREETALRKANRELRLLSGVSQALVRSIDEKELISRFCHVVVDNAPYRFAAVVAWDESMPDNVRIVTRTGDGSSDDESLLSDLAAIGAGAIRTGQVVRHGTGAAAGVAFPLRTGFEISGALLIRAWGEHGFDESEVALVTELAGDLAFGLHTLRTRTAHRAVQDALTQSEARFRATFEQAAVGVAHVAPDGHFIRVNHRLSEITGYSSEELSKLTFEQIAHADDSHADAAQRARLLSGEVSTYNVEQRLLRKDGTALWANITTSLVTHEARRPSYFITVVEDITAKRSLEAQLRQSQKMEAIGLLAGGIAHEFNNMLSVILGNAEMSLREVRTNGTLTEYLQTITEAANRGADITRQLLAFARKETASPVVLDVNAGLTSLTRMLDRVAGEDISIETKLDPSAWRIKLDPTQLDQVILNLVTNARDAMDGVGTITLETRNIVADAKYRSAHRSVTPGEYVAVQVADTGIGMDAATLDQLFQPFFTTKPLGKGTGLGLPVVLGISQRAGGHVLVDSAPGKGARFTLLFPKSGEAGRPSVRTRKLESGLAGTETVLLVEDEAALLALTRRSLESYGYHVLPAGTPAEAIELAESYAGEIALLLTDVVMPGMNGRELYERMSSMRPGIHVVFMSGYPADIVARRGEVEKEAVYVQKPFALTTLVKTVRQALD